MSDQPYHMWKYWRDKKDIETLFETIILEVAATHFIDHKLMNIALARLAIDHYMECLEADEDDENS